MFSKFLPLAVIFILGFALKKARILKKEDSGVLGTILLNIVAPAAIASAFAQNNLKPEFLNIPIIGVATLFSLLAIGYLLSHLLGLKGKTRGAFLISFPTFEGGTIGYALMFAAFGGVGLSRIALFDSLSAAAEFSVIYALAAFLGGKKADWNAIKNSLAQTIKTPIIWAMLGGIILNIFGFGGNPVLQNTLGTIGAALIPLVMLLLGLEFEPKVSFGLPIFTFFAKLAAGFGIGLAAVALFHLEGVERVAVIAGATLPTSLMAIVFSKENNLDTSFVATLIAIALPVYLILFGIATAFGLF